MNKTLREIILWILILIPIIYLDAIWSKLPEIVPTHFNMNGVPNGWSHKSLLLILSIALGSGLYLLMLAIPYLDPRKAIKQMGTKYYNIRLILTLFTTLIITYLIYASKEGSLKNPNYILVIVGTLFVVIGFIFKTIKPNHFIGIRTPWTLESDVTWEKTHRLASPLWIGGGAIIALMPFIFHHSGYIMIIFLGVVLLITMIPIVYSYFVYRKS